jgi:hypothetical protein
MNKKEFIEYANKRASNRDGTFNYAYGIEEEYPQYNRFIGDIEYRDSYEIISFCWGKIRTSSFSKEREKHDAVFSVFEDMFGGREFEHIIVLK